MLSQGNIPTGRISTFTSQDTANKAYSGDQTGVVNPELCTRTVRGTVELFEFYRELKANRLLVYIATSARIDRRRSFRQHCQGIRGQDGVGYIPFDMDGYRLTRLSCQSHLQAPE